MDNGMLADISAVTRNNGGYGGFGYGCEWLVIIVLFALFGGYGGYGGFGGRGSGLTQVELQNGFDTQSLLRGQDGIKNGLCDGFYAMNTNFLQGQNQLQRDLCQGFSAVTSAVNENRFANEKCCCQTQNMIEGVKYADAKNTCDIINAIHSEGEATRGLITQNKIEAMQTKITELTTLAQAKDLAISQANQNAYLVNKLQPCPIPAYMVQNPNCCANAFGCQFA